MWSLRRALAVFLFTALAAAEKYVVQEDLRLVTTTEEGLAWAADNEAEFQKTIAKFRAKGEEFEQCAPGDGWERLPWAK